MSDSGGNIFITDQNTNRVRRLDWQSRIVSTIAGNGDAMEMDGVGMAASFNSPNGISILNDTMWVVDSQGGTVRKIGMLCLYSYFHMHGFL